MITQAKIFQGIDVARMSHERWVKRAQHLVEGLPVDKHFIPLEPTECGFGRWFYGEIGSALRKLDPYKELFDQIEYYHNRLHEIYKIIYTIYFVKPYARSFWHKVILLNNKNVTSKEKKRAQKAFEQLQTISMRLKVLLNEVERITKEIDLLYTKSGMRHVN